MAASMGKVGEGRSLEGDPGSVRKRRRSPAQRLHHVLHQHGSNDHLLAVDCKHCRPRGPGIQGQQDQAPAGQCPPCKPGEGVGSVLGCPGVPLTSQDQGLLVPVLVGGPAGDSAQVGQGRDLLHHSMVTPTGFGQCQLLSDLVHASQLTWGQIKRQY